MDTGHPLPLPVRTEHTHRAGKRGWGGSNRIAGAGKWLSVSTCYLVPNRHRSGLVAQTAHYVSPDVFIAIILYVTFIFIHILQINQLFLTSKFYFVAPKIIFRAPEPSSDIIDESALFTSPAHIYRYTEHINIAHIEHRSMGVTL